MSGNMNTEPLVYSVRDFCRATSICKASFYALVRKGEAPPMVRIGKRAVIRRETAEAWLKAREMMPA